jgi:hypothetical protein
VWCGAAFLMLTTLLVLLMRQGSSLKVQPVAGMLSCFSKDTPLLLINREIVGGPDHEFDVELTGNADDICAYLTTKLGWTLPEIDPTNDHFRIDPVAQKPDQQVPAAVATPALDAAPAMPSPLASVRLVAASPTPRPPSPVFISPNRYIFAGSTTAASPSPSPSPEGSPASSVSPPVLEEMAVIPSPVTGAAADALSPEPSAQRVASSPRRNSMMQIDSNGAASSSSVAASAKPTPHSTPLRMMFSPKLDARPPPLQLGSSDSKLLNRTSSTALPSGHPELERDPTVSMSLTCTPTRSARHIHALPSPLFRPLPPPAVPPMDQMAPAKRKEAPAHELKGTSPAASAAAIAPTISPPLYAAPESAEAVHHPIVKRRKVGENGIEAQPDA